MGWVIRLISGYLKKYEIGNIKFYVMKVSDNRLSSTCILHE